MKHGGGAGAAEEPLEGLLDERWLRLGEWDVHYLASRGPTEHPFEVLYLAGFIVGGHSALPLAKALAPFCQLYVPDLPGYGQSSGPSHTLTIPEQAEVTAALLDALAVQRIALVANSFSAEIAVEFAVRYPDRLWRLVLIAPAVDSGARTPWRQLVRFIRNSFRERVMARGMWRDYFEAGPGRVVDTARYALQYALEEKLACVAAPTLVVRGSEDAIVSQEWTEQIARRLPDGKLVVLPGQAHGPERAGVAVLAPVIREFLTA